MVLVGGHVDPHCGATNDENDIVRGPGDFGGKESKDEILSVSDLTALPRFRAIMLASGAPATMIETIPYMNGPYAERLKTAQAAAAARGLGEVVA